MTAIFEKYKWVIAGTLLILITFTGCMVQAQELKEGRFQLFNGHLSGFEGVEPPKVTLMVDSQTGQTFMLVIIESKPTWITIPHRPVGDDLNYLPKL